jgi:hypothetical protein
MLYFISIYHIWRNAECFLPSFAAIDDGRMRQSGEPAILINSSISFVCRPRGKGLSDSANPRNAQYRIWAHTVSYGETPMRDLILQCSGVAAIVVALIHGVLGETKVFAHATIEPSCLRTLIRLVWQAGTVAWIGGGVLLIAAPLMGSEAARHWIILTTAGIFGFGALANAWAMRGRHFGWVALSAVVALAVAGY